MKTLRLFAYVLLAFAASPTFAWNGLGHKVIADIAWQEISEERRARIVAILRRHPRFDDDFAKRMPADAVEDRWIFQQAATWPDLARSLPGDSRKLYDQPTWHYVNFPLFISPERPLPHVNLSLDYPRGVSKTKWNVGQAIVYCEAAVKSNAEPRVKALAYCWLFHLVGDVHQPMHSTALFCDRFPNGDRGGNSVPVVQGENLHSAWDNLLGRQDRPNDVKREVAELQGRSILWNVARATDVKAWIEESHELAKSFAYSPTILDAVAQPGELTKISLPPEYLRGAGEHARARIVAAGVRLATMLEAVPISSAEAKLVETDTKAKAEAEPPRHSPRPIFRPRRVAESAAPVAGVGLSHWLNTSTNVRHNSSCRHFENTKQGRLCSATEGKACGQCGG